MILFCFCRVVGNNFNSIIGKRSIDDNDYEDMRKGNNFLVRTLADDQVDILQVSYLTKKIE